MTEGHGCPRRGCEEETAMGRKVLIGVLILGCAVAAVLLDRKSVV